jgi:hypothetical protein
MYVEIPMGNQRVNQTQKGEIKKDPRPRGHAEPVEVGVLRHVIGRRRLGLCCIPRILGRVTPCQSDGHMSEAFLRVPLDMEGVAPS